MGAQNGFHACLYFHAAEAIANGATGADVLAAVEIGMVTGRLDAALAGMEVAPSEFREPIWFFGVTRPLPKSGDCHPASV